MRVETNAKLIERCRKIAQYLFFGSFGVLVIWLITSTQQMMNPDAQNLFVTVILPTILLPVAFICSMLSVRFTNLWVRRPRPEEVIRANLKGLSNRSVLYNYYHFPARHVLICPQGVYAIITRFQDGHFSVNKDEWVTHKNPLSRFLSIFRFDRVGNPTTEAQRAAAHIQAILQPIASDVPVQPLIIFVDPRVKVEMQGSLVPILFADQKQSPTLKDFMREEAQGKAKKKHDQSVTLSPEQIEAFEAATLNR
jgi:hypothetical protein